MKGNGKSKINRVNLSLTNNDLYKLRKLAISCGTCPTSLVYEILIKALNDGDMITQLQEKHGYIAPYRIQPITNTLTKEVDYSITIL